MQVDAQSAAPAQLAGYVGDPKGHACGLQRFAGLDHANHRMK